MRYAFAALLGLVADAVLCVVVSSAIAVTAGYLRHGLEAWTWLLAVTAVPSALGGLALAVLSSTTQCSRAASHAAALIVAFAAGLASASAGVIVVESALRGFAHVNVAGYLAWSPAYAAGALPVSYPLALIIQTVLHRRAARR